MHPLLKTLRMIVDPNFAKEQLNRQVNSEIKRRYYEAGRASRATYSWAAASTSANAEIYGDLVMLRNRSRELVRNHGMAKKALRILKNNVIGTGIIPQPQTGDVSLDGKIGELWKRFADECDFGDQLDIYGLQALAYRSMIEGGDMLTRLHIGRVKGKGVPLELQLLEGDFLDHRKNTLLGDGGRIQQGVETHNGKRTQYWLFPEHPGDAPFTVPNAFASQPVTAANVLHLYEIERIGQIRGVPWFTAGMIDARQGQDYWQAELMRKRISACIAAIVLGGDDEGEMGIAGATQSGDGKPASENGPDGPIVTDTAGNRIEAFEPGMIALARGGKDIKFSTPPSDTSYPEYRVTHARDLATAWDVMYEQLTSDLSKGNFSSLKAGANEFRRACEVMQWLTFMPMWLTPVYRRFIDMGVVASQLPKGTPYAADYTVPMFESVDRLKDTQDDVASIRALLTSPQERIRRRGGDPEKVLAEAIDWHKQLLKAGVVSDADATLVQKPGAAASPALRPEDAGAGEQETTAGEEDATAKTSEGENAQ